MMIILLILILTCIIPFAAAEKGIYSDSGTGYSLSGDQSPSFATNSANAGGNSGNSNAGGNSGNSNAGGNSGNSNAGDNSGNSNAGGNSGNSNAGGNSGNSNAGGNSGNSNAGGNSGNSNAGGNSGNSNAGGNSGNSNAGGNSGSSNAGGNSGNSNAGGNSGSSNSLGISGSQISDKDNTREISINIQQAERAGEKVSVGEQDITITKGEMTITIITAAGLRGTNGEKSAAVRSISMEHKPVTSQFKDMGTVSASFRADLMSLPPADSALTAVVLKNPGPPALAGFDRAAGEKGYDLAAVAYAMDITKTNLDDGREIGPATITMTVSPSWVDEHGGVTSVRIARLADDGTSQLLRTRYRGIDSSENQIFEGDSPGGLSIFALITIREPVVSVQTPQTVINVKSQPEPAATGSIPFIGLINPAALALPLVFLGILLIIRRRIS